ncbi:outer membrane autotransporter protein [Nitrobacteraceae bacterium AZCC 1564]
MRLAGLNGLGIGARGPSSRYRAALLVTTALLSVAVPSGMASAQQIIDGGVTVDVPATQSSPWNIGGSLTVGDTGAGTLNIINGGVVTSISGSIGQGSGSNGKVVIDGSGSLWSITNQLDLGGLNGIGGITVSNGGALASGNSIIGNGAGSSAAVFVTDAGTLWSTADILVGQQGNGTLSIANGGQVISTGAGIGFMGGSTGTANVSGAGSLWSVAGGFIVGGAGSGTLYIDNGGQVSSGQSFVGNDVGGVGNVSVDGAGSAWNTDALAIGYGDNSTGKLKITNNAAVNSLQGVVGGGAGSIGSVDIDGLGSAWTITNDLTVGYFGNGTIKITNGGQLTSGLSTIGREGLGSVTVDGAASTWTATAISVAAVTGGTGHLTVTNGGVVTSLISDMATQVGSVATADVSGAGSTWNAGGIIVGVDGDATLNVSNGGKLISDVTAVGAGTGSAKITIAGTGSSWAIASDLITGQGQITVSAGATMSTAGTSVIGVIAGRESQILITGAGSSWTTGGDIYLGGLGGNTVNNGSGSLIVTNGGAVDVKGGAGTVFVGTGNGLGSTLIVDGTLNGQVSVNTDGRLGGSGTIGNTTVNGTIAPGNSIGTLNIAGNLTMQSGSTYEVETNATGQADKIVATGTTTINGGTVKVLAGLGNYAPSTTYTIINAAGGVSGVFDTVTSNFAFLAPTLTYDPNNVYLTLIKNASFASVGVTPNQIATGGGLDILGGGAVYNAVLTLTEPEARAALDALSGEIHASAKSILIDDSRFPREAAINRLRAAFGSVGASSSPVMAYAADGPVSAAADTDRFAVWGQGFGAWGQWKGDGNAAQLNRTTGGFIIGADGNVSDAWRVGGFAGYSTTSFDVQERRSSGGSDNYHVGLYGGTQWNALNFRSGVAYTWHDLTTSRSIAFTGFTDAAKAKYNAGTAQAFGELGYGFNAGPVALETFANLAYVNLRTDAFTENGGAAALTTPSSVIDTTFTTLGLRASNSFILGTMVATAKGSLGWRHAFGDTVPVATLAFAGENPFNIAGVPIAQDAAVIDAGLDFHLSSSAVLGLSYGGQFGAHVTDQTIRANFSAKF